MNRWLEDFTYRINIGLLPFALAAVLAVAPGLGNGRLSIISSGDSKSDLGFTERMMDIWDPLPSGQYPGTGSHHAITPLRQNTFSLHAKVPSCQNTYHSYAKFHYFSNQKLIGFWTLEVRRQRSDCKSLTFRAETISITAWAQKLNVLIIRGALSDFSLLTSDVPSPKIKSVFKIFCFPS